MKECANLKMKLWKNVTIENTDCTAPSPSRKRDKLRGCKEWFQYFLLLQIFRRRL